MQQMPPTSSEERMWANFSDISEDDLNQCGYYYFDELDEDPINASQRSSASTSSTLVSDVEALLTPSPTKRKLSESPDSRIARRPRLVVEEENTVDAEAEAELLKDSELPVFIPARLPLSWSGVLSRCTWGVLWEIARLSTIERSRFDFAQPIDIQVLRSLEGTNVAVGPKVHDILRKHSQSVQRELFSRHFSAENAAKSPWQKLDEEELCLAKTGTGGTGCQSDDPALQRTEEPYGGLVEFVARLKCTDAGLFQVALSPPQRCPSTRFSRRFGSKRFFRLHVAKDIFYCKSEELMKYVQRPFVIMKHVFRAFTVKDSNVFFVETYEEEISGRISPRPGRPRASDPWPFLDFVNWHNPLECNNQQTMAKWASRFALGLSNSVPGVKIKRENMFFIPDINSEAFSGQGKVPGEQIMTDGCGFTNKAAMRLLRDRIPWDDVPTAIQCRIAGAKGLLLLHPDVEYNEKEDPMVWIRDSQKKIAYYTEPNEDPAMLTIDVLRNSHMNSPARLSPETIINLYENGVPWDVFRHLFEKSLDEALDDLLSWASPQNNDASGAGCSLESRIALWASVARAGGVLSARIARHNPSSARARGLVYETSYAVDSDDDEEEAIDDDRQPSSAWWPDPVSGQPSSLEETIMALLDSGFDPRLHWIVRVKLKAVISRVTDTFRKRCKIPVLESCTGFIVPDPCGVLEEGEIQVKSSHNLRFSDGWERSIVLGDVLVTRHPCKLPSDIQKVKAVERPELREYTDVIVFSTKGKRSLASLLAGGDYDGDKVEVFWNPAIVEAFKTPSQSYADEPPGLSSEFKQENESVDSFLARMGPSVPLYQKIHGMQRVLLAHVYNDGKYIGIYNEFYIKAMFTKGYRDMETKFLAYKFNTILDGVKTGKRISKEAYERDKRAYGGRKPKWNETEDEANKSEERNLRHPRRPRELGTFVMDKMQEEVALLVGKKLTEINPMLDRDDKKADDDLLIPHHHVVERIKRHSESADHRETMVAEMLQRELKALEEQVEHIHRDWLRSTHVVIASGEASAFTRLPIEERQKRLRTLSQRFSLDPSGVPFVILDKQDRLRIKASYAYKKWHGVRFPWDISTYVLCQLKSTASSGTFKPVVHDFYYRFKIYQGRR